MEIPSHQGEALHFVIDALFENQQRCLVQMPCGTGLGDVGIYIAQEWLRNGKVIWLTPSGIKLGPIYWKARHAGIYPDIETPQRRVSRESRFVFGTYETAWHHIHRHCEPDALLILDEAHHINTHAKSNLSIYRRFRNILGLSSSPWTKSCFDLFEKFHTYRLSSAIKDGVSPRFEIHDYEWIHKDKYQILYARTNLTGGQLKKEMPHDDWILYRRDDEYIAYNQFIEGQIGTAVVNRTLWIEDFDKPAIKKIWIERDCKSPLLAYQMLSRVLHKDGDRVGHCYVMHWETKQSLKLALELAG